MSRIASSKTNLPFLTLEDAGQNPTDVGQIMRNGNDVKIFTGSGLKSMTNAPVIVRKTADETVNNSATLQNDDELLLAVKASEVWIFIIFLVWNSGATPDILWGWSVPSGTVMRWGPLAVEGADLKTATDTRTVNGGANDKISMYMGIIVAGTTAGNVNFRWSQNTATASDTTVKTNSLLIAWKAA